MTDSYAAGVTTSFSNSKNKRIKLESDCYDLTIGEVDEANTTLPLKKKIKLKIKK